MITPEDIKRKSATFTEAEKLTIEASKAEIDSLLHLNKVNEEALQKLQNIISNLQGIKDNYMWRLIRAAKQNHMLD